jgi:hypothetical protein
MIGRLATATYKMSSYHQPVHNIASLTSTRRST